MPELKKSSYTKAAVIKAAKMLFYEKGYVATHYNDIVDESGVNAGSVYYHFKKKNAIAAIIYCDMMADNKEVVNETFMKYDLQVRTAIETIAMWKLFYNDEKLQRFYYEASKARVPTQANRKVGEWFYDLHNSRYQLGLNLNQIKAINATNSAAEEELIINLVEKYIFFEEKDAAEFDIRLIYDSLKIDYKRTDEIIQIANEAFLPYDARLNPYFKLEIFRK